MFNSVTRSPQSAGNLFLWWQQLYLHLSSEMWCVILPGSPFPPSLRLQFGLVPHHCGLPDIQLADSVVPIFTFSALSPMQLTAFAFSTGLSLSLWPQLCNNMLRMHYPKNEYSLFLLFASLSSYFWKHLECIFNFLFYDLFIYYV